MKRIALLIFTIIVVIWLFMTQYRNYYNVGGVTFTVWKQMGGKCYVILYKYYNFANPKQDYMKISNIGEVFIYFKEDTSMLIFDNCSTDSIECNFKKYKYKVFRRNDESLETIKVWENKIDSCRKQRLNYFYLNARNMDTYIKAR